MSIWEQISRHKLYILLAISIIVVTAVYLLVPQSPDSPYAPPPTVTPSPTPLLDSTRLTNRKESVYAPTWSPDGARIAFGGKNDLFVMQADGSDVTHLGQFRYRPDDIAWSPDGKRIAFVTGYELYLITIDGSELTKIKTNELQYFHTQPVWSPDGRALAFISDHQNQTPDLYMVDANNENVVQLTSNRAWTQNPAWSPDSRTIAFDSTREGHIAIYTVDVACVIQHQQDAPCLTRLTDTSTENRDPTWSPDGTHLAFTSLRDGNPEIYIMNADGSNQIRLTNSPNIDRQPQWSPDGAYIAFLSNPNLQDVFNDIYIVRSDGSARQQLTNEGVVYMMSWSPNSQHIAFVSFRDNTDPKHCSSCVSEIYVVTIEAEK